MRKKLMFTALELGLLAGDLAITSLSAVLQGWTYGLNGTLLKSTQMSGTKNCSMSQLLFSLIPFCRDPLAVHTSTLTEFSVPLAVHTSTLPEFNVGHLFFMRSNSACFISLITNITTKWLLAPSAQPGHLVLEKELPTCSAFESLTTLEIGEWNLTEDLFVVLGFLQLSPRLEELTLMHRPLVDEGAEIDGMPIDGMTFQCPLLESVVIQCSEDDEGIDKLVNVLVVNGISLGKIDIAFYDEIEKRDHVERTRAEEERLKELCIFEKMAKKNPEWIDDDPYARGEPDSEQSDEFSGEFDDPDDY